MSGRKRHERGQSLVEFALVLPLMVIMLFAILDFARVYTTLMSVESAAREAADFGTTLGAGKWQDGAPMDATVAEMQRRACIAASDLTGYADPDADPATGNCTNPSFAYCMTASARRSVRTRRPERRVRRPDADDPVPGHRHPHVRLPPDRSDEHRLLSASTTDSRHRSRFQRDSTFAMTDIDLSTGP